MTRRRRSKVRSKTRSESSNRSEDEVVYCVCRSSDGTRFMIACDNCEEWYHGDCINVTPKQAANIKRFFCHLCVGRNPSLEIEYKTGKEERVRLPNLRQQIKKINFSSEDDENDADLSSSSSPDKSLNSTKRAMRKRYRTSISESVGKKRRGRPKERLDDYDEEATEDEVETSGFVPSVEDNIEGVYCGQSYTGSSGLRINSGRTSTNTGRGVTKMNQRSLIEPSKACGVCENCKRLDDCGQCDVCTRYGVSSKNVCRKRRCVQANYRCQVRKSYHTTKNYGSINDEDFDGVVEDSAEYRCSGNIRRRNEFEISEIRQRLINPVSSSKSGGAVGSKMRRGDHLPGGGNSTLSQRRGLTNVSMPYKCCGEDSLEVVNGSSSFRCYQYQGANNRLSRVQPPHRSHRTRTESDAAIVAQMSSNTSSVSGRMSSQHYEYADDSDEDVMIPNELLSHTTNGQRPPNPSDSKAYCSYVQEGQAINSNNSDQRLHEYGLSYQDHLYCKHHRSFNWQSTSLITENSADDVTASRTDLSSNHCDQDLDSLRPPSPGHHFMVIERPVKAVTRLISNDLRRKSSIKPLGSLSTEKRLTLCNDSVTTPDSFVSRLFNDESYQMVDLNDSLRTTSDMKLHHKSPQVNKDPSHSATSLFNSLKTSAHTQDFYTINDEDDLEINWPKDTVNV